MAYSILISSNERKPVMDALGECAVATNLPYDFRFYTKAGVVAAERKHFPNDLLASVTDGRLAKECAAMRHADYRVLISEGHGSYDQWGYLKNGKVTTRWTRGGIRNLYRSIRYVEGIDIEFTKNIADTAQCLHEMQNYFDHCDNHISLRVRNNLVSAKFMYRTMTERYLNWLQGLPSVGYKRAMALSEAFTSPCTLFEASEIDIQRVSGVTKPGSVAIHAFLHDTRLLNNR